jgi:hypothetical protein
MLVLLRLCLAAGVWDREVGFLWHRCGLAVQGVERERASVCVWWVMHALRSGV